MSFWFAWGLGTWFACGGLGLPLWIALPLGFALGMAGLLGALLLGEAHESFWRWRHLRR